MANPKKRQAAKELYDFMHKFIFKPSKHFHGKMTPSAAKEFDLWALVNEAGKLTYYAKEIVEGITDPNYQQKTREYQKVVALLEQAMPADRSLKFVIRTDNFPIATGENAPNGEVFLTKIVDFRVYKPDTPIIAEGPFVPLGSNEGGTSIVEIRGKRPTPTPEDMMRRAFPHDERVLLNTLGVLYGIKNFMEIPVDDEDWEQRARDLIKLFERSDIFKTLLAPQEPAYPMTADIKDVDEKFVNENKDFLNGNKPVADKDLLPPPVMAELPAYVGDVADKNAVHFAALPPRADKRVKIYHDIMHTSYAITRQLIHSMDHMQKTPPPLNPDFIRRAPFPGQLECAFSIDTGALRKMAGKNTGTMQRLGALFSAVLATSPELNRYFSPLIPSMNDDEAWKISMQYGHYRRFADALQPGDCCCLNDPSQVGGKRYVLVLAANGRRITEGLWIDYYKYSLYSSSSPADTLYVWAPMPHKLFRDDSPLGHFWGPALSKLKFIISQNYSNIGVANTQEMFISWIFRGTSIQPKTVREVRRILQKEIFPISGQTPVFPGAVVFDFAYKNIGLMLSNGNLVLMFYKVAFIKDFAPAYVWYPH